MSEVLNDIERDNQNDTESDDENGELLFPTDFGIKNIILLMLMLQIYIFIITCKPAVIFPSNTF